MVLVDPELLGVEKCHRLHLAARLVNDSAHCRNCENIALHREEVTPLRLWVVVVSRLLTSKGFQLLETALIEGTH